MTTACSRCGIVGITFGGRGLCSLCRQKEDLRDQSAYYERIQRENDELAAKRAHPANWKGRLRLIHGRDWIQKPFDFGGPA